MLENIKIKRRERDAVLQSLQAGLVPKIGLHLLQVGRKGEITALLKDIERIKDGGAAFRVVVGRFGSGKSFFLNLLRTVSVQQQMVVAQADFTMQRRLYATGGQARALYTELVKNLATRARPEGNALRSICESWISSVQHKIKSSGGDELDVEVQIESDLKQLQDFVGGFEFSRVMQHFYRGYCAHDENLQACAIRWIRGEYTTKTEARQDLEVRRIIDDESVYDSLKLLARFFVIAGYGGLFVNLDEMVVLSHRLPNSRARQNNYEAVLSILNDCLQGNAEHIGFVLSATDECLEDERRGLFSYEALRTRLAESDFVKQGLVDLSGPVIRLQTLTPEELLVLLQKVTLVHANGQTGSMLLTIKDLAIVLEQANSKLGADFFKTPRDIVRSVVQLLNIIEQNPGHDWKSSIEDSGQIFQKPKPTSVEEQIAVGGEALTSFEDQDDDEDLSTFRL